MFGYIARFFTQGSLTEIIAKAVAVLFCATLYFVFFNYAKRRNMGVIVYTVFVCLLILLALAIFSVDGIAFYVYFFLGFTAVFGLVLFVQDFHRDLFRLSVNSFFGKNNNEQFGREDLHKTVGEVVKACQRLSRTNTGALIVVAQNIAESILDSGTRIGAEVSTELLETTFFPKTPLHDGAVVISSNKVVAAGCYLPLTEAINVPREFGTRHRAGMGVSELYPDSTTIVVSEETGIISAMHDGKIKRYLDATQLQAILECAMRLSDESAEESIWGLKHNG